MKCEETINSVIQCSTRTLTTIMEIPLLSGVPHVCNTRNGQYQLLKSQSRDATGTPISKTSYLGRLTAEEHKLLQQSLADAWPVHALTPMPVTGNEITQTKLDRREASVRAQKCALSCGYGFHGRHIRKKWDYVPTLDRLGSIRQFKESLEILRIQNDRLLALYSARIACWCERRIRSRYLGGYGLLSKRKLDEKTTADGIAKSNQEIDIALNRIQKEITKLEGHDHENSRY